MNFMGMNNQMTDDLSSRIKIIIEPYEKKIKDLEDQIRQKDFEITVLKEKLYKLEKNSFNNNSYGNNQMQQFGMNQMPQMGMNQMQPMGMNQMQPMGINQMPQMGMNQMQPIEMPQNMIDIDLQKEDLGIINLIFRFSGISNDKISITQKCFSDDEFGDVKKKVLKKIKAPKNAEFKFIFNAKKANDILTIAESGMMNNSNIFCSGTNLNNSNKSFIPEENLTNKRKINLIFKTSQGLVTSMTFDYDISIGFAIKKYLIRVGKEDLINSDKITFIYNANRLKENDTRLLKDLTDHSTITIIVSDVTNLIGAK